jgi:YD repeat-containing protein
VETTTDGKGTVSRNIYDDQGRVTSYQYDPAGRLIRTTFPDGSFTATGYDELGRQAATTDRNGETTRYEYDPAGRQAEVIDALGCTTSFSYDDAGSLHSTTDPAGRVTTYHYDALNRRFQTDLPDGPHTRTEFGSWIYPDPDTGPYAGRVEREIDQMERVKEPRYDWAGPLLEVHQCAEYDPDNQCLHPLVTRYAYDVRGNRTRQTDAELRSTSFSYDTLNRLRVKTWPQVSGQPEPDEEAYAYDQNGNLTEKLTPNGDLLIARRTGLRSSSGNQGTGMPSRHRREGVERTCGSNRPVGCRRAIPGRTAIPGACADRGAARAASSGLSWAPGSAYRASVTAVLTGEPGHLAGDHTRVETQPREALRAFELRCGLTRCRHAT